MTTPTAPIPEPALAGEKVDDCAAIADALGLFPSVIKSGEPWTLACQTVKDRASAALCRLGERAADVAPTPTITDGATREGAAWTPGPWRQRRSPNFLLQGNVHIIYGEGNFPTAFVPAWDAPGPGEVDGTEEARANAWLIAAAPALFEALRLLVADVAEYPAWERPCHALDVAEAALASARQEPRS